MTKVVPRSSSCARVFENLREQKVSTKPNPIVEPLAGKYLLGEQLGCGGFGTVHLATHVLTGGKVAIKIIDKKKHGKDMKFIETELQALKELAHQNICRMYQQVETKQYLYFIMEYCNGGEMFDYIIKKERLEESEARHFFRQLIQAMAYVHSSGYCHRDLKPENLLITDDLKLKLIDFGLCAKPNNLYTDTLKDYCGSPAYAAPELFDEKPYLGHHVDLWSMGVILYTLLCGCLPFEDESLSKLRQKVLRGMINFPPYLSQGSREILRELLTVNPRKRITMEELIIHPWITKSYMNPLKFNTIYKKDFINMEVAVEMSFFHCVTKEKILDLIKENKFDYLTATYLILLHKKENNERIALPIHHLRYPNNEEGYLDCSGMSEDELVAYGKSSKKQKTTEYKSTCERLHQHHMVYTEKYDRNSVYARAKKILGEDYMFTGSPSFKIRPDKRSESEQRNSRHHSSGSNETPVKSSRSKTDKENHRPSTLRARLPQTYKGVESIFKPISVFETPKKAPITMCAPQTEGRVSNRSRSIEHNGGATSVPNSPLAHPDARHSRVQQKTPRLKQRVFASLERKADRMINLLTPKRLRSKPSLLKQTKGMVNVSITSSNEPERVKSELRAVFEQLGLTLHENGWKLSGEKMEGDKCVMSVELEVVCIENLEYVGVKRRRLKGDGFLYKKLCEQILQLAGL
uniref:Non-specific serine/threonine protein kinase n=1 Tax=Rhabditophanes sp. KR3021 TaxID=114890 RepID=A0AC35U5J6_9BILA